LLRSREHITFVKKEANLEEYKCEKLLYISFLPLHGESDALTVAGAATIMLLLLIEV
jgi:hypothetical protein